MVKRAAQKPRRGFTLAELLVALLILGVIAAFTIPKVLLAQQSGQKAAVFKEVLATLDQVTTMGWQTRDLSDAGGTQSQDYYLAHLNTVKQCKLQAWSQGCWTQSTGDGSIDAWLDTRPGVVLHNGATVAGFEYDSSGAPYQYADMLIDWNGPSPPNQIGQDMMWVRARWDHQPPMSDLYTKNGQVSPWAGTLYYTQSLALYNQIFQ